MNLTKIFAAILVLGALVLASVAWWLGSRPAVTPAASGTPLAATISYPVVVALHNLDAGKAIATGDIELVTLPINPSGVYTQTNAVVGKVPMVAIGAGNLITESLLASGLALKLSVGERAVAIPVDEVAGAGNRVQPGDFVDVFVTLKQGQELDKSQSRLLLSRVRVLSYGTAVIGSAPADASANGTNGANGANDTVAPPSASQQAAAAQTAQAAQAAQAAQPAHSAVLATPVADVNRLSLAIQSGKLMLALRNPADDQVPDVALFPPVPFVLNGKSGLTKDQTEDLNSPPNQAYAGVELTALAGDSKSTARRSPMAPVTTSRSTNPSPRKVDSGNTVEVIRGLKREAVVF
ncbi:Flp pilus assembly protein CpaB [Glaciimonas immobilis]|uniref:Pilus assembly protein CpaB n=1 Tax=Glaciimonas immobilis TaxID=728004 RepID=A0A840RMI1_9BURK|nr:Flp pilus assembly protein CpaB [Glaciimonas immobilis]KAF3998822.1 Flp pilus assembly protein CpaB [Glaciimonas immobilis]MBB5198206.1 pilus assembly protein CpaB [Glaciimonas immobilis]